MIKLNGKEIKPTIFPDKTSQVWKVDLSGICSSHYTIIEWIFENEAELIHIAQLKQLVDHESPLHCLTKLVMPYLPYARQDKDVSNSSTFALRTFAKFVNMMRFDEVEAFDPHSKLPEEIIERFKATAPNREVERVYDATHPHVVYYPDKGAWRRYTERLDRAWTMAYDTAIGDKVRNQETGEITGLEIRWCKDNEMVTTLYNLDVLMIDDLCDGGTTFIKAAEAMKKMGARNISLYVSHGLFTKREKYDINQFDGTGLRPLINAGIRRIFTREGEVFIEEAHTVPMGGISTRYYRRGLKPYEGELK